MAKTFGFLGTFRTWHENNNSSNNTLRREAETVAAVQTVCNLQLQQFPWKCKLGLHAAAAAAGDLPDTSIRYKMLARRCNRCRQLAALSLSRYLTFPLPRSSVSNCNNRSVARWLMRRQRNAASSKGIEIYDRRLQPNVATSIWDSFDLATFIAIMHFQYANFDFANQAATVPPAVAAHVARCSCRNCRPSLAFFNCPTKNAKTAAATTAVLRLI